MDVKSIVNHPANVQTNNKNELLSLMAITNEWTRVNVLINPKKTVNMLIIIFEYRIVTT